ncbi:MAG TPA: FHA domain-containing protein [Jatrophihabitantaceae bacterium]|jgi:hypothetical protein
MSSEAAYTPGTWVAVGAEAGWLLVDIDPTDAIVLKAWSLLRSGAEIDEILDAVLQRGLRAVSSFALVRVSGERRAVVVRGSAAATVTVDGTDEEVSAEGVATWREYALPAQASAVRLRADAAASDTAEAPLSPGVTLASSLRLSVSDVPLPAAPSEPPAAPAPSGPPPAPPELDAAPHPAPDPVASAASQLNGTAPASPPLPMPPEPPAAEAPPAAGPDVGPPDPASGPDPDSGPSPDTDPPIIPWLEPPAPPEAAGPPLPPPPPAPAPAEQVSPPAAPPQGALQPPPGPEPEPDSMSWLAAVKPLGPPSDDSQPYRNGPPPGVVSGGGGIGREGLAPPPPAPGAPPPGPPQGLPAGAPAWPAPPPGPPAPDSPDSTVSRASLTGMAGLADQPGPSGLMVQAVRCQHGHLSPPMAVSCRVCGFPLMGQAPVTVPRPTLGVLRLSTGDVVPLDRTVIMGRNPKADESNEAERPHVVRLPSPGHDISRTHVEIRLDGWHVLLTDLNSVNGTVVTPPWQEPQRLRPNEAVPIEPGTVVSLADEVTFRYEVTG